MYLKGLVYLSFVFLATCNTGNLTVVADLPSSLKEVSGIETINNSDLIWMINDSGNKSELYGVNTEGKIVKVVDIKGKNHDYEDLTSDKAGNIYIGDFGNNFSDRKNLSILIVKTEDLDKDDKVEVERVHFEYEDQKKFPPKKKHLFYDCESFFYWNDHFYLFTKSRVKDEYGKTSLYKLSAKPGNRVAKKISSFENCNDHHCWITSADISSDGKKIVLLTHQSALILYDYEGDDFFSGQHVKVPFDHISQKESVCFIENDTAIYVADEYAQSQGLNLYRIGID